MQRFITPVVIAAILAAVVSGAMPADAQGSAPPATNIRVLNGYNPGEVIITWEAVPEATHYRIGYVNMDRDYARAKASATGDWREAFSHVDVDAQNFEQGTTYTLYGLQEGARHAFAVLTNDSRYGEPTWPSNPAWQFLTVTDWGGACPTAVATPVATPGTPLSNVELTRRVRPALVQLTVTPSDGETYSGTGFVVRSDGLVVTNRHVIDDAETVTARMNIPDGRTWEFTGQVLGRGILADLAVIQLDANRDFATLPLGDSDAVAYGDAVTAWGYPISSFLGTAAPTLTLGIISSPNRIFEDTDYLQTDASLAPGNSGGPLIDRYGSVVGVNTSGVVNVDENGTRIPIAGIYLSITSNEVKNRLDTLASGGPSQATYRNLRFDYGYRMDIPRGWYLGPESKRVSRFIPYAGERYADIITYESIAPFLDKSTELAGLINYIWDTALPKAAENWDYFRKISATKMNVAGEEFYRLEYRVQKEPESCLQRHIEMVSISASFPNKPYLFSTVSAICEDTLAAYSAERETMLNSFRP